MFKAIKTSDGHRNVTVQVTGAFASEGNVLELVKFDNPRLKLTKVTFAIREKACVSLWWDQLRTELILPLEGKSMIPFDGVLPPANWDGVIWVEINKMDLTEHLFLIVLDFDK